LASVQHSRFEQQHRRHRTHLVHPAHPPACHRSCEVIRGAARGGAPRVMDRELLLEIGCEEIPASWLPSLTQQVGEAVIAQVKENRLPPEAPAETYSTPRRLTVRVGRLAERQSDLEELVNGPPVSAAFQADGSPTPAATGFAAKQGVDVAALERLETPKGTYL